MSIIKKLSTEDLENFPSLKDRGLEVGSKVEIPDDGSIGEAQLYIGNDNEDDRDHSDSSSDDVPPAEGGEGSQNTTTENA